MVKNWIDTEHLVYNCTKYVRAVLFEDSLELYCCNQQWFLSGDFCCVCIYQCFHNPSFQISLSYGHHLWLIFAMPSCYSAILCCCWSSSGIDLFVLCLSTSHSSCLEEDSFYNQHLCLNASQWEVGVLFCVYVCLCVSVRVYMHWHHACLSMYVTNWCLCWRWRSGSLDKAI